MAGKPTPEFGRRRPAVIPAPAVPVKRSGHVALLLMGTFAVGGGAYALMPRENCTEVNSPAGANCGHFGSSFHGYSGGSSRYGLFGFGQSSRPSVTSSESAGVTRGGFGSFAEAMSSHFSARGG